MKVSAAYLGEGLARAGCLNVVSAITLDYRALDTLGEASVLFVAIIGVLAVARKVGREKER
jgi:multisubunit Na+/H+ antiporter MnhB subunit